MFSTSQKVYAFGSNKAGQLGIGKEEDHVSLPKLIDLPTELFKALFVSPASDHSFVLASSSPIPPIQNTIDTFSLRRLKELMTSFKANYELEVSLDAIFSHAATLNGSFLQSNALVDRYSPGIDYAEIHESYDIMIRQPETSGPFNLVNKAIIKCLLNTNSALLTNAESLRFYVIIMEVSSSSIFLIVFLFSPTTVESILDHGKLSQRVNV